MNPIKVVRSGCARIYGSVKKRKKIFVIASGVFLGSILVLSSTIGSFAIVFENRIYPHVFIGDVSVGSLTKEEAHLLLEDKLRAMLDAGLTIYGPNNERELISLRTSGSTDPDLIRDLITQNVDIVIEEAYTAGREQNFLSHVADGLLVMTFGKKVDPQLTIDTEAIEQEILRLFGDQQVIGSITDYKFVFTDNGITASVIPGSVGNELTIDEALDTFISDTRDLSLEPIVLTLQQTKNPVTETEAEALLDTAILYVENAPYTLTYTSQEQKEYSWEITGEIMADWVEPKENLDDEVFVGLSDEAMEEFLSSIHREIDVSPRDAKFVMENGRVTEFVSSLDGVTLDDEKTLESIQELLGTAEATSTLTIKSVSPSITTGSTNNLGIQEILGVGTSNYSTSSSSRITNIKHGSAKLNGLLIAPGETISLIENLRPFTLEDGYLPEMVIKGDKITPEIGGGLCQIGTTAFRAVMNSGLEMNERTNHSLVVSYYNDPMNGNPGTDATLYDPNPDLKFTNNMENYILLTTEIDEDTRNMYFTFWGTSDGRKGYYTAPKVLSWTGYGETQYIETPDLAPGVQSCQSPHSGATTSFDYIVEYADGTVFTKNYTSIYRSLAKICLVGVDPNAPAEPEVETPAETPLDATPETTQ
ncbi:MAG: VanW family protein [Patescibacteria group bacterium]|jgi:vancomycin resistance protein YoaR